MEKTMTSHSIKIDYIVFDSTKNAPHELYVVLSVKKQTIEIKSLLNGNIKVTSADVFKEWSNIPELTDNGANWN